MAVDHGQGLWLIIEDVLRDLVLEDVDFHRHRLQHLAFHYDFSLTLFN